MTIQELIDSLQNLTKEQKQKNVVCVDPNGFVYQTEYPNFSEDLNKFVIEIDYGSDSVEEED